MSKVKVEKDTSERWLLTYADLMNLLLIFFIIMYAMSQVDIAKFNQLAESLRAAFGDSAATSTIGQQGNSNSLIPLESDAPANVIPSNIEEQQMEEVKDQISDIINKANLQGNVDVSIQDRGVIISIKEKVLFNSGSAEIEAQSKATIIKIGEALKGITGNYIRVEGHTDNDPIRTSQFPSNWELSALRASNVLRMLVDQSGIDPKLISSVGYGEYRPKYPNTTAENKTGNRRVDIVIMKNVYENAESGAATTKAPASTSPAAVTN